MSQTSNLMRSPRTSGVWQIFPLENDIWRHKSAQILTLRPYIGLT